MRDAHAQRPREAVRGLPEQVGRVAVGLLDVEHRERDHTALDERGRFVAALPAMVAMFARYYGAGPTSVPRRRATRERSRRSDR